MKYIKNIILVLSFVHSLYGKEGKLKTLQVHFTYNNVQDFCVVKSKTKRFAMGKQMETVYALSKQLNLKMKDITLTHYYVC